EDAPRGAAAANSGYSSCAKSAQATGGKRFGFDLAEVARLQAVVRSRIPAKFGYPYGQLSLARLLDPPYNPPPRGAACWASEATECPYSRCFVCTAKCRHDGASALLGRVSPSGVKVPPLAWLERGPAHGRCLG